MLKVHVPAKLSSLEGVNDFIAKAIPEDFQAIRPQVELAVEELLVNIFNYAYTSLDHIETPISENYGYAQIACFMVNINGEHCFCLRVRDWGKPFNPFIEAPEPDISLDADERPIGGLGLFLIKSMVTHYTYSYVEQSNRIELFFGLPKED